MRKRVALGLVAAAFVAACGGGDGEEERTPAATFAAPSPSSAEHEAEIARVVRDYFNALAVGDAKRACSRMSPAAQVGAVALGRDAGADTCEEAVASVAEFVDEENEEKMRSVGVDDISVRGDTATAVAVGPQRAVTLSLTNGTWEIVTLEPVE